MFGIINYNNFSSEPYLDYVAETIDESIEKYLRKVDIQYFLLTTTNEVITFYEFEYKKLNLKSIINEHEVNLKIWLKDNKSEQIKEIIGQINDNWKEIL
jgi:hypothetical protein